MNNIFAVQKTIAQTWKQTTSLFSNKVIEISTSHIWTILCAWSFQEAARYIETLKAYENNSAELIKEKIQDDATAQFISFLTHIRSVNKTDATTLGNTFGSIKNIANASIEDLEACAGIGSKKAERIYEIFRAPFYP